MASHRQTHKVERPHTALAMKIIQDISTKKNKIFTLHSKKTSQIMAPYKVFQISTERERGALLSLQKQFLIFPCSVILKQRDDLINFRTFIVSYLFAGVSFDTYKKVFINYHEMHLMYRKE